MLDFLLSLRQYLGTAWGGEGYNMFFATPVLVWGVMPNIGGGNLSGSDLGCKAGTAEQTWEQKYCVHLPTDTANSVGKASSRVRSGRHLKVGQSSRWTEVRS